MTYKFLEHTADLKILAMGENIEQAFIEGVIALKEVIAEKMEIKPLIEKNVEIKGNDLKNLLYLFLEEILFLLDAEDFFISKVKELKINKKKLILKASLLGDKARKYNFNNSVKAITYNEMKIKKSKKGVEITFVVDV